MSRLLYFGSPLGTSGMSHPTLLMHSGKSTRVDPPRTYSAHGFNTLLIVVFYFPFLRFIFGTMLNICSMLCFVRSR